MGNVEHKEGWELLYINKLVLRNFGKFKKKEFPLNQGINIIYGDNEAGKSTIHSFIRGMFFGIDKSRGRVTRDDFYTKYQPMDTPGAYEGSMEITCGGEEYLIYRCFYQKERCCQVINLSLGKEEKVLEDRRLFFLPENFNENIYRNTISIEQLRAKTDAELVSELRNFIANLTTTKASEVDVGRAINSLIDMKKSINLAGIQSRLEQTKAEIQQGIEDERREEELLITLKECTQKKSLLEHNYENFKVKEKKPFIEKSAEVPFMLEKYQTYLKLRSEVRSLEDKISGVSKNNTSSNYSLQSEVLKNQIEKVDVLFKESTLYEEKIKEKQSGFRDIDIQQKNFQKRTLLPFILGLIICVFPTAYPVVRVSIGIGVIALGMLYYLLMSRRVDDNRQLLEKECKELESKRFLLMDRINDILFRNNCNEVSELRDKYGNFLKKEIETKHLELLLNEYEELLRERQTQKELFMYELQNYLKHFMNAPEVSKECMIHLEEQIMEQQSVLEAKEAAYEEEIAGLSIQIERIKYMLEEFRNIGDVLSEKISECNELEEELLKAEKEIKAITLAIITMKELSSKIHDSFGNELSRKVSEIIYDVTNGKYKEVIVDEQLSVKVLYEDKYIPLERLSIGTIEQVYFSLRIMLSDLFFESENMPIILDDSFVYYDDERLKSALLRLSKFKNRQIILFTCHHREKEYLEKLEIPFTYQQLL